MVVSLQNCMNEERIAGVVGWERDGGRPSRRCWRPSSMRRAGCAAPWPRAPRTTRVYRVGEVHGRITRRLEELAAMIATIDTGQADPQSVGRALVQALRQRHEERASAPRPASPATAWDRHDRDPRVSIRLGSEAVRVGQALGYELEHIRMARSRDPGASRRG